MATGQTSRPWVLAGGLSFACLELIGLVYGVSVGRVQISPQMLLGAVMLTALVGSFGLLVGFVFAQIRGRFGLANTYVQAVVVLVLLGAVLGMFTKGVGWLGTLDFALSSAMSAGAGLLFAYAGLRFGANGRSADNPPTAQP